MPIGSRKPKKNSSIDKARRQSAINALAGICESAYLAAAADGEVTEAEVALLGGIVMGLFDNEIEESQVLDILEACETAFEEEGFQARMDAIANKLPSSESRLMALYVVAGTILGDDEYDAENEGQFYDDFAVQIGVDEGTAAEIWNENLENLGWTLAASRPPLLAGVEAPGRTPARREDQARREGQGRRENREDQGHRGDREDFEDRGRREERKRRDESPVTDPLAGASAREQASSSRLSRLAARSREPGGRLPRTSQQPAVPPPICPEDELSLLLDEQGLPPLPGGPRARLLAGVEALERFTPHAQQVAAALRVEFHEARRALHALSDLHGWMDVPILPGLFLRPAVVRSKMTSREVDGAAFARIEPGGRIPAHHHHGPEVMVVLQGALIDAAHPERPPLLAGGVLSSEDGTTHELLIPASPSVTCFCLVVNDGWAEYL